MPVIPKAYLYAGAAVGVVLLVLAVAASYKVAYDKGEAAGTAKCKAAISAAAAESLAKSQKEVIHVTKKLQSVEDKINASTPDDDGPISRVLRDQLDRMH